MSDADLRPLSRPAAPEDLDELVRLDAVAREHLGAQRGGDLHLRHRVRRDPPKESLRHDLADPATLVLAGCIGPAVVGYCVVAADLLSDGRALAVVSEIFVEPAARGVGVGRHLLLDALGWARERGCVGIDAWAMPGDRETKNFFEAAGLTARAITVHRDLGGGRGVPR